MTIPTFVRRSWHVLTLRGSRSATFLRMRLRAVHPVTFNQRLYVKMLRDRRPILTTIADKVDARGYIAEHVGEKYVCPVMAVGAHVAHIDWTSLPEEFVAKVSHGSGGQVIVTSDAREDSRLPAVVSRQGWGTLRVRPEHADRGRIKALCQHWLTLDYSWSPGRKAVEWCYLNVKRRVIIEPLLRDSQGLAPREYRVFVISGRVAFIQAELDCLGEHQTAVMSPRWQMLPVTLVDPAPTTPPPPPPRLQEMLDVALALARPLEDFIRVDFYDLGTHLLVGELTNYPSGGQSPFSSRDYAKLWGRNWNTPY